MPVDLQIKPTKTKAQARKELEQEVRRYLSKGGEVQKVPTGVSGNDANKNLFAYSPGFGPKKARTPVDEAVKALDSRKNARKDTIRKTNRGPKKKLLTDDFGEPIRWIWEES